MSSSALWLYEFKFQMVSGLIWILNTRPVSKRKEKEKIRDLHYNL